MKYIKTYEQNKTLEPSVGDYLSVSIPDNDSTNKELQNYLNNNIARMPWGNKLNAVYIIVNYFTKPNDNIIEYFSNRGKYEINYNLYPIVIYKPYIIAVSKNKKELKAKIQAMKYNI